MTWFKKEEQNKCNENNKIKNKNLEGIAMAIHAYYLNTPTMRN